MNAPKKTDDQVKRAQSRYETSAQWSGVAVVVGLTIEVWLAVEYRPSGESFSQTWGPVFADALIALGVFFEILFGRWALHQGAELQQRSEAKASDALTRAAAANLKAEQLQSENLTLHRVMTPRHVGLIGIDGPPPAQDWFAGMNLFAGTDVLIQFAPDAEAKNLANEIVVVLGICGWRPQLTDESRSHLSLALMEGVRVMSSYLDDRPWTAEDLELVPYTNCAHAGDALARSLTAAGLGVGNFPIHCIRFASRPTEDDKRSRMIPWFDPPGAIVYVQVGARPIAATLQWMASQRKAIAPAPVGDANNAAAANTAAVRQQST